MAKHFVSAPLLAQLNSGALEVSVILLKLAFKSSQKRKSVGCGSSEAGKYTIVIETTDLLRASLHDRFTKCDLTVTSKGDMSIFSDKQHSSAANAGSFSRHFWLKPL